jgi:hypothetical protein
MKTLALFVGSVMVAGVLSPAWARIEDYGHRRYTQVGHFRGNEHGHEHEHEVIINRHYGPGWGGVVAGGLIGAAAGLALGSAIAGVPAAPPPMYTVVPALPGACATVPTYNGGVVYNCGGVYYAPYYEGYSLMYQVVPAP